MSEVASFNKSKHHASLHPSDTYQSISKQSADATACALSICVQRPTGTDPVRSLVANSKMPDIGQSKTKKILVRSVVSFHQFPASCRILTKLEV